jgi:glycosyltransferase involved in cell wall biosynthesis
MKKIVLDCRFWGPSHTGLGRYTQSLTTAIYQLKPDYDIHLLINPRSRRFIHRQLPRFKLAICQSRPYSFNEQLEIPQVLNQIQPDLVHFLHFNVPLFYSDPFIVTIHDLVKHHSKGLATTTRSIFTYPLKRFGYFLTLRHAVNQSQAILTPSQWVKKDILKFYPVKSSKITLTPEAAAQSYLQTTIKAKLKPPSYPYLIYIGNAYPHKNLIQLIKAVQIVAQTDIKNLKLVIVTARDVFYQRLRQQIRQLKAQSVVKIKGFTSDADLKALYHHSQAFITASLLEGFGLPGLEAMASKTLVLSSNRASLPEVYAQAAVYFNPEDLDDMVKKIKKVLSFNSQQRQKRLKKGFQHVQTYSWEKTAQQTLKIYENCLGL